MTQRAHQFEKNEGGCLITSPKPIEQPIAQPLDNLEEWLSVSDLVELSGVSPQGVQKALAKRRWRGCDLLVETITGTRGNGGKTHRVHVDRLPADLKQAWYLQRGIDLHQRPAVGAGNSVSAGVVERDGAFAAAFDKAKWRLDIVRPALAHPKSSTKRAALIRQIVDDSHRHPGGYMMQVSRATVYAWITEFEGERAGIGGLISKRRCDKGGKRTIVSREWDRFFTPHISTDAHHQTSDAVTHYIRSLWGSGENGRRAIAEKATTRLIAAI